MATDAAPKDVDDGPESRQEDRRKTDRAATIAAVRTPLGFYSLIVLVVEGILGGVYLRTSEDSQPFVLAGMFVLVLSLLMVVTLLSWFRPEALFGTRPTRSVSHWRHQLKVGDNVRIVKPPATVITRQGVIDWKQEMGEYYGERAQIVDIVLDPDVPRVVKIDVDAQNNDWAPEWLEPAD